ncbi:D-Ala-D-Ala carboxypeptidase family metallohydrolase [Egibacter rhizosphaerae]|nr:D-Ala-D-Ala carboxypeptidase family metallohydrolase [Egibacter rhizosphaerae]
MRNFMSSVQRLTGGSMVSESGDRDVTTIGDVDAGRQGGLPVGEMRGGNVVDAQPAPGRGGGHGEIDEFLESIAQVESGGQYHIRGPQTRHGQPLGKYQILDSNWDNWAAEAGIPGADWRDPQAQDRVAQHKMLEYYQQFGSWDGVAVAWFAGPGRAHRWNQDSSSVANIADTLGTSVEQYVDSVLGQMHRPSPGTQAGAGRMRPQGGGEWTGDEIGRAAETIAESFGMRVTSHHRSEAHNERVGGATNSDHLWGGAVDFAGSMEQMRELADWAEAQAGPDGPFRIVLHPWNDPDGHDDHVHISWHRGANAPVRLDGFGNLDAGSFPQAQDVGTMMQEPASPVSTAVDAFRSVLGSSSLPGGVR